MPLVSVVIATRNRADLLREAIDSVFAQQGTGELFDLEVIVVDDASSDHTPNVVARYGAARNIRLNENRGLSGARNAGIEASTGKYVAFSDDDDLCLPEKLRLHVAALERDPSVGVAYGQYYINQKVGRPILVPEVRHAPSGWVLGAMLTGEWHFSMCNVLVRRDAFGKAGYFDETATYVEDRDMLFRLAFHVPFVFVPGPVFVYRPAIGGLGGIDGAKRAAALRPVLEKVLAMLPETEESVRIKEIVWAQFGLQLAPHMARNGDLEEAYASILRGLRAQPAWTKNRLARKAIASFSRALGVKSREPIEMLGRFCKEIVTSTQDGEDRGTVRAILADVWREGAIGIGMSPRRAPGIVGYAAVRAASLDPIRAASRDLLKALAKSVLLHHRTFRQH